MNVTCHNCNTKFTIPDRMIPIDKTSIFKCPKCKEKIEVPAVKQQKKTSSPQKQPFRLSSDEKLNALICIESPDLKNNAVSAVKHMGLNIEVVTNFKDALKKLQYHIYHLVIMDDIFDQNKGTAAILDKMNTMDMSLRRRICLVWISNKFKTNDNLTSLHFSVNAIFHQSDISHLEQFLSRTLSEHKNFYTVYNDSMKTAGKG